MPQIKPLPPSVINKIAAGEVIERPASVVKELLENSVDAGATRIDVTAEQGGSALVRVADNGGGIEAAELALAVASHATSKIREADELFQVRTLGFRGEALASMAEVSHLRLRSRVAGADAGAELEVMGGQASDVVCCGCPVGTVVEVRNLFYNTPVRRKFLRSTQTEMGHVGEAFTRIALAHPSIHFTLRHNDRSLYDLPPVDSWRERIATFFGAELNEALIWVDSSVDDVRLSGYVASPNFSRANNRMQYLFLNGRYIRDRSLQHALSEAYRGLLMTGRFPIAFLRLDMRPDAVDVNVHPTKLEVRFQDGGRIYSQVLATLRTKFLTTDLTQKVQPSEAALGAADDSADDPEQAEQHRRELSNWAQGRPAGDVPPSPRPAQQSSLPLHYERSRQAIPTFKPFEGGTDRWRTPASSQPGSASAMTEQRPTERASATPGRCGAEQTPSEPAPKTRAGLQLHNRYLVTESEEGMLVIDQHALHERILYEQLREKVLAGQMETQRLLVPETVSLTAAEAAAALDARETLQTLGIEVEPFGGDTVLVSTYPAMLANFSPHEVLRQVVELLLAGDRAPDRRDLLDELLHMISCKAAIKAGDRLSPEEVNALLEQRHLFQDTHHCPHGRPAALVFTREELDKRFKRV